MRYANEMGCCTPATSQPRGPQSSYTVVRASAWRRAQRGSSLCTQSFGSGGRGPVAERAGRGAAAARRVAAAPAELLPHGPTAVEAGVVQPEQRVVR